MIDHQILMDSMILATPGVIALISLGITLLGVGVSTFFQFEAAEESQEQADLQKTRVAEEKRRSQRVQFRKRQVAAAETRINAQSATGGQESSSIAGSLFSQIGAEAQSNQQTAFDARIFTLEADSKGRQAFAESAARAGGNLTQVGIFGTSNSRQIASVGDTIFGAA